MSNAAQRLGPPSGAGWTCQRCGTRNAVSAGLCSKCGASEGTTLPSLDTKIRSPIVEGDSVTSAPQSDAIDLRTGQRRWEGDHRVVITSRDMPWNSEILIDGKKIDENTHRVEIDLDCEKAHAIVKLTRYARGADGRLVVNGDMTVQHLREELTANLLNLTLDEARVVDVILNKARQEAMQSAQAVQLFAIAEEDEDGGPAISERILLSELFRDAKRYRALASACGDERIIVKPVTGSYDDEYAVVGSLGLEALSETLVAEQAAELRAQKEKAQ